MPRKTKYQYYLLFSSLFYNVTSMNNLSFFFFFLLSFSFLSFFFFSFFFFSSFFLFFLSFFLSFFSFFFLLIFFLSFFLLSFCNVIRMSSPQDVFVLSAVPVTCVWLCEASRRWTARLWPAPCWVFSVRTPRHETSSWLWSGAERDRVRSPLPKHSDQRSSQTPPWIKDEALLLCNIVSHPPLGCSHR